MEIHPRIAAVDPTLRISVAETATRYHTRRKICDSPIANGHLPRMRSSRRCSFVFRIAIAALRPLPEPEATTDRQLSGLDGNSLLRETLDRAMDQKLAWQ